MIVGRIKNKKKKAVAKVPKEFQVPRDQQMYENHSDLILGSGYGLFLSNNMVLRVWRMRHGDKDEDEKNDDIDYRMLMLRIKWMKKAIFCFI